MNSDVHPRGEDDRLKIAIKEEQITVASDNRATINIAMLNESATEDNVEILVKGVPAEWLTIPTPVVHLAAGQAKVVAITIQPTLMPEGRVGEYPLEVRVISQSDPKRSAIARRVLTVAAHESRGRIGVLLGSVYFSAIPGSILEIPILLRNRGSEEDSFRLSVTGLPPSWVSTSSTVTRLEPDTSMEIQLTLQVPHTAEAAAGQMPFTIQVSSEEFPTQTEEVDCVLTIAAFSRFSTSLEPSLLAAGQAGQLIIQNEGNTIDTFILNFRSPDNRLLFEKTVQVSRPGAQAGAQQVQVAYAEIPPGEKVQVGIGEQGVYSFRVRPRARPLIGGEQTYPFTVNVISTGDESVELAGQVSDMGMIPSWLLSLGAVALLVLCLFVLIPLRGLPASVRATQTASFNQTQAALSGPVDSDGDGLTNDRETALGTNPVQPDSDGDRLLDGDEVDTRLTNPLDPDTDDDGLPDGDEIQTHQTDPRNPDGDGDGVRDGDEIGRGMDPRNPDTDGDRLRDGDELRLGTDPRNPDSDNDGLADGDENPNCPQPRDPDSDDDGIIDGRDLDRCDPANPLLTATALAGAAQATALAPTAVPTGTPVPTSPPAATPVALPPNVQGVMLFSSNRDGNAEIYALNLGNQSLARLTNNPSQDEQPALAPDAIQVAYVSNQNGNNEIYLTGQNNQAPVNLTNQAGDDQQPAWSPDGNWIAFTTSRDGNQEIYIMRRDGSQVRNLTSNAANDFAPTWFSVGGLLGTTDWIAFTSMRDGNPEVYKVRPDGTGLTNLTQNPANDHSPAGFAGGAVLAFVSDRNGNSEIYTMSDNGSVIANISNSPAQDLDPAINPTGNWIAFSTDRDGNLEVYLVGTTGGTAYNLTRNPSQDGAPDW